MHSIKIKIILLFCVSVLGVYCLLVFFGVNFMQREIENETSRTMTMLINQEARELNANFEGMERALTALEGYVRNNVDTRKFVKDEEYTTLYLDNFEHLGRDVAAVAGNVYAFYFRADPDKYGLDAGVFVTDNNYGEYVRMPLTDLSQYDEDDREHVAWFYEPKRSGQTQWLEPYVNKNINVYMTSFVTPIYLEGKFYGVVGLDLDMEIIQDIVDSIEYLGGSGYLLSKNGDIVYSKTHPEGLKAMFLADDIKEARNTLIDGWAHSDGDNCLEWKGKNQRIITKNLRNGMILAVGVPVNAINRPIRDMINKMLAVLFAVALLLLLTMRRIHKDILLPIRRLKEASSRIAKGELNTQIDYHSESELGELSDSINSIAREMRKYFAHIHSQAYTDGMTGVGNKTSYLDMVKGLERKIEAGMASFGVIVFDMNGLKQINDRLGHEVGDGYITDAAEILKNIVGAQHVYRIGGDEFMVVLENVSEGVLQEHIKRINAEIKRKNEEEKYHEEPLAISMGVAIYDPETDQAYKDVFKRADEAMYRDKSSYYQGKFDRRRR